MIDQSTVAGVPRCKYTKLPPTELLREVLDYDPGTGFLYWRAKPRSMFKNDRAHSAWNAKYVGKLAFHYPRSDGYRDGIILDKRFLAHRIVWKLYHGADPFEIDHIDGDRTNNRIQNLRNVSPQGNSRNLKRLCTNSSGVVGVCRSKNGKRWVARIGVRGAPTHIGTFDTQEEAVSARLKVAASFGFSDLHGVRE